MKKNMLTPFEREDFCAISAKKTDMDKEINRLMKIGGEAKLRAHFLMGVRYHKIVCEAAGIL